MFFLLLLSLVLEGELEILMGFDNGLPEVPPPVLELESFLSVFPFPQALVIDFAELIAHLLDLRLDLVEDSVQVFLLLHLIRSFGLIVWSA